jgi:poly-beta-1,6-N-acetyl-D-glucosamine N-deacetylase
MNPKVEINHQSSKEQSRSIQVKTYSCLSRNSKLARFFIPNFFHPEGLFRKHHEQLKSRRRDANLVKWHLFFGQLGFGKGLWLVRQGSCILVQLFFGVPLAALAQSPDYPICPKQNTKFAPDLTNPLNQVAAWLGDSNQGMIHELIKNIGSRLSAYFTPSPWPSIQENAQLARVPIIMYHDIRADKQVFFDVTPQEFENQLRQIKKHNLNPISLGQLITHLQTGIPLPGKPILLTFDDGYLGHYLYVYPLLKKYNFPAVFSIYTDKIDAKLGRPGINWQQLRQMSSDPLIEIAAHSVSHPQDLRTLSNAQLHKEVMESKLKLEKRLGIPIHYFTYPEGKVNSRVAAMVRQAGYIAAFTMDDWNEGFAGQSENLLAIKRFGQSGLAKVIPQAWGGPELPISREEFNFSSPVKKIETTIDNTSFAFIEGGKPITIHAKSRYQVSQIIAGTAAIAAVDGGFFSLRNLDSNVMIGPVLSQSTGIFIPGNKSENQKLQGRPLVLINPNSVQFLPFDPSKDNNLAGIKTKMLDVTDAFVAAAWLVKDNQPQSASSFKNLYTFDVPRDRAFWGINQAGEPKIGVSHQPIDSVSLGTVLTKAGFRDAVMLDSGASASLAYRGQSLMGYIPRPVPHVVALVPPGGTANNACNLEAFRQKDSELESLAAGDVSQ